MSGKNKPPFVRGRDIDLCFLLFSFFRQDLQNCMSFEGYLSGYIAAPINPHFLRHEQWTDIIKNVIYHSFVAYSELIKLVFKEART